MSSRWNTGNGRLVRDRSASQVTDQSMQRGGVDQEVAAILEGADDVSARDNERLTDGRTVRSRDKDTESAAERIIIPLPGLGTLELPSDIFDKHLLRAQSASIKGEPSPSELLDADQLEQRTRIPASWWAAQARERRVPFHKFGRYVRFDITEVFACDAYKRAVIDACGHAPRRGRR